MSMWDYDEESDLYPPNNSGQCGDPYASHSGSSDYHGGYGSCQSDSDHNHHNHGYDQHPGHGHGEHDNAYSYRDQRSRGTSLSPQNYGWHHESYAGRGNNQGHGHDSHNSHGHDRGHESYVSPSYSSCSARSPAVQLARQGRGHQSYDMSSGYEILQEHQAPLPSTGHSHEAASRDLFTSDSVVNLTLDEIDALARTHRSRSWLVVLYAPWCHFCQAMEPNFERVAHHLEQSNVYVGRFRADGDYKEYAKRHLQLEHFPTILFFPKDSSNIVKYQSENREVDVLLEFVHMF